MIADSESRDLSMDHSLVPVGKLRELQSEWFCRESATLTLPLCVPYLLGHQAELTGIVPRSRLSGT